MRTLLVAMLLLWAFASPAAAERLVSTISRQEVSITSSFQGETLTFFGNVEPEAGAEQPFVTGPYHIIIVITGPLQDRVARRKDNVLGIWINTEQVPFEAFPSYFHILSDTRLSNIASRATLETLGIDLHQQARLAAEAPWWDAAVFGHHLVRLMREKGLFGINEQGVLFRSNTFYSAQITLASDVVPGPYLAHTYLFKDGVLVAERSERFSVRKIGFERFLGLAAVQQPLLYGIAAVILALFTGWLGGVVFRR
jgi:uncharacterized protein (TIGR02186 family)